VCATELHLQYYKICIITIYRAPSEDLQYFLNTVEEILNSFHNKFNDIILCGDININYCGDTPCKIPCSRPTPAGWRFGCTTLHEGNQVSQELTSA
jgi:hypothetical protein